MARIISEINLDKLCKLVNYNFVSARNGHHLRGKPPGVARTLEQRLKDENQVNEELIRKVDIGLPPPPHSRSQQLKERLAILKEKRQNHDISKQCKIPIDLEKSKSQWLKTVGPHQIKDIALHYGIFDHLYDRAYFHPRVPMDIQFTCDDVAHPVYYGNIIKPKDAKVKPQISYETDNNTLWTLVLTSLDGNLFEQDKECLHWMVANIPGNQVGKGETIFNYLQPFPPKGAGYHRYAFVLYKQNKKLDFTKLKYDDSANIDLQKRTFSTHDFYKERQDDLTPGGLAFFQADWDPSVHNFFHNVLKTKEPIFEYDFDPPYIKPQRWYPIREPFNLYMDKYRDPKQINKEFLVRKLKNVHPFKPDPKPLPHPNAQYFDGYVPSWLKLEIRKSRMKWGRINDIE